MTRQADPIDVSTMPDLARLADEVARTRTPRILQRGGEDVALLVPAGGNGRRHRPVRLIDTSMLPPVPFRTIDELIAGRPTSPPPRAFTDDDIAAALEEDRVDRWRQKNR